MMTQPTLLVMAAGMGSRYGGLKQIDPVGPGGETLMDYSIFDALRAGFAKVVFVIRKDIEQPFKETIGAKFEKRVPVEYAYQELDKIPAGFKIPEGRTKPWGTTQAVLVAEGIVNEPFAVINADDFYGAEGYQVLAQYLQSGTSDYAMVGFVLRNTLSDFGSVARGVSRADSGGYLQTVVELTNIERNGNHARNTDPSGNVTDLTGDELVSMNMWGFNPQIFPKLRQRFHAFLERSGNELKSEHFVPTAVNELVSSGQARVKVLRTNDAWFGVTYREDRPRVVDSIAALIQKGKYPGALWK
jgi:UTP-glucose-1-phosphate uridylyltransferase